ncbi:MAG: SDR family oxidoreductase [Gammaproteobacteria bacterium]|nr:SDR family oxidoreductase [Gammaproteobacteria bacterium]
MKKNTRRVALITGSTDGIGAAIARRLSNDGFAIALHSRSSQDKGLELAEILGNASYTKADLAEEKDARHLIQSTLSYHGRLDVIVNNAAMSEVIPHRELKKATPEIWRKLYDVNVIAPWVLIAEAEAALRESSTPDMPSCILNITSHAGVRPKGASIPYAVTKSALNHMTKLLALNLGPEIRVNAIAPGLVDTPMTEDWDWARDIWREKAPMQRGARPEEIADIANMLIESSYLTGEVLLADGGLNLT